MPEPVKTPEQLVEDLKGVVTNYHSELEAKTKEYGTKQAEVDESLKNMEKDFAEKTEALQNAVAEREAKEKDLEENLKSLEVKLSRANSNKGNEDEIETDPEIKEAFFSTLRYGKSQTSPVSREVLEKNFTELVNAYYKFLPEEKKGLLVKNLLAEGSDPDGGMWCPVPMDTRIRRRMFETSPMRQVATVMTVNTQAMTFALDDEEVESAKTGEINVRNETNTPQFGKVRIDVHELFSKPKATLTLLEDNTINLESWLSGKVSRKFGRDQNKAFIVGTDEQEARGILDYPDASDIETYERFKLGTMETATTVVLAADDLIDLQSHLLEDYQPDANWFMHRLIWAKVLKLTDQEGQYLLNPRILFEGAQPQLLGAPVRLAGDMPKPDSAGDLTVGQLIVAYGDFGEGYTILDRLGINVIRDNITESGFVKWYFRTRYGGGVTNFQAIKRLKVQ